MNRLFCVSLLIVLSGSSSFAGDVRVDNAELGFSLTVPSGFAVQTNDVPDANRLYAYAGTSSGSVIHFGIIRQHHMIAKQGINPASVRPELHAEFETAQWNGCNIDVCRSLQEIKGMKVFELDAIVPLKKEGITVEVAALEKDKEQVRAVFTKLLASLQGQTNWDSATGDSNAGPQFS